MSWFRCSNGYFRAPSLPRKRASAYSALITCVYHAARRSIPVAVSSNHKGARMTRVTLVATLVLSFAFARVAIAQSLETVLTFDPNLDGIPESVTVDGDGNVFFSMGSSIRELDSAGQLSTFGSLPI